MKGAGAVLGGLLFGRRAVAEGTGTIVDGSKDASTEQIGDFLESFDCGVTWKYRQSCASRDWCFPATDWPPESDPDLWSSDERRDVTTIIGEEDCLIVPLESGSGTAFHVSDDGDDAKWAYYTADWDSIMPSVFQRDGETIRAIAFFDPIRYVYPSALKYYLAAPEGTITYWHKPRKG